MAKVFIHDGDDKKKVETSKKVSVEIDLADVINLIKSRSENFVDNIELDADDFEEGSQSCIKTFEENLNKIKKEVSQIEIIFNIFKQLREEEK